MSRLTDKNNSACLWCVEDADCIGTCHLVEVYEKLKHYEDLEEQGRLITLPCKVGTEFYYIVKYRDGRREILSITLTTIANILDYEDGIGKWLYFTKEEAEEALKRLQSNE